VKYVFGGNGLAHETKSIAINEKMRLEIRCITTAEKRTNNNK